MKPRNDLALLAILFLGTVLPAGTIYAWSAAADSPLLGQVLPWQREMPLREAAKTVLIESTLNPTNPLPDSGGFGAGGGMTINNLKMRTTLWGPPDRITISLNKNNVWDRRVNTRCFQSPTLQEITDGVFSPANKGFVGKASDSQRPRGFGYLLKEGGFYDGYRQPVEYPMPCMKPVGQIIVGMDPLAGAELPQVTQSCANGVVQLQVVKGEAKASLKYVLGMTSNLYAVRGEFTAINSPVWLRLFRHRDTAHTVYMDAEGTRYTRRGAEADKDFNAPMDPPSSGQDGRYFWIRQKMPPEKTFPQGFEYVLMGIVIGAPGTPGREKSTSRAWKDKRNWARRRRSPPSPARRGAAATATFTPSADGKLEALITIVTTMDGPDVMALARHGWTPRPAGGFDGVVKENKQWWNDFYDKREEGRVFHGLSGLSAATMFAPSIGAMPTAMAAAPRPTCGSTNAALPMGCRNGTFNPGPVVLVTTRSSPPTASFAIGATARTCGSRSSGIGWRPRRAMPRTIRHCPACASCMATCRRSRRTNMSTPRSLWNCAWKRWRRLSARLGRMGLWR